ncbi:solute carrier family 22 member 6-like [Rhipicephalus microplus]|uniref:solute carrier family 22 member 6-like n=1 Tax=Rhipicephalus microplus TaxID=6941 RepID=UPI003F6B93C9
MFGLWDSPLLVGQLVAGACCLPAAVTLTKPIRSSDRPGAGGRPQPSRSGSSNNSPLSWSLPITRVAKLCTALVRYQLALDTGLLPINPYYNFLIGGSIEVVSGVACLFILWYLPRKCSTIVFMVSTMASYVLHACLPKEYNITESILMLAGRLCIGNVININIIYLSEVFPTNVRALATGVAQTIFGVGGVIQPFLNQPFNHGTWDAVFYAIVMLLATLVVFPWPETKGRPLPDFVENVEATASSSTSGSFANSNDTGDIVVHYNPAYNDNQEGASAGSVDTDKYWNSLSEYTSTAITMEVPSFDQGSAFK